MATEMHVGDDGIVLKFTIETATSPKVPIDVSASSSITLFLRKPSGTVLSRIPTFVTDGTDGKVQYVTTGNEIDTAGKWKLQLHVVFPTSDWYTAVQSLIVRPNLS